MRGIGALAVSTGIALAVSACFTYAQDKLPNPTPAFQEKIGVDVRNSVPAWPSEPSAPKGAPNIVLILVDDAGFGETSTFGGPAYTPNFDQFAADGLRYNEFQVNAICSPTRAALLSGRNAHEVGFGNTTDAGTGYPGYNTVWPKSAASVAEVLKDNGYSTAAFGKWHNTPVWDVSPVGPFDRWPTGLGFEYFYGFMAGQNNQYYTRIYKDTTPVEPPTTPDQGYDFTHDMTNQAIRWMHEHDAVAPGKPFFIYFAPGAVHAPHQVPKKWIDLYKGKFNEGWDELRKETFARQKRLGVIPADARLTPRPPGLRAWSSLSENERKLLAHQAQVYAGYVTQVDYEIGRLLKAIHDEGQSNNTMVLWIFGDNGGNAQGGPLGFDARDVNGRLRSVKDRLATAQDLGSDMFMNDYAAAWGWAESCPFQGAKVDAAHLGGTRDPLVISWPARIKDAGSLRSQFSHVTDIAPTLYQVAGITPPKEVDGIRQTPLEGVSLVYTFDHANAPTRHRIQYFEARGNRSIYKDGWWADDMVRETWDPNGGVGASTNSNVNLHPWELYDLKNDYSQANNLADKYPAKLKEMKKLFDEEARRNHVYPLLARPGSLPLPQNGRATFVYSGEVDRIPVRIAPKLAGRSYTLTADVDILAAGSKGVIFAIGGRYGGTTLFVLQNHLYFEINRFGNRSGQIVSSDPLVPGKAHIVVSVTPAPEPAARVTGLYAIQAPRSAAATLTVNGKQEGAGHFRNVEGSLDETLDIGCDLGSAVSPAYQSPNRFTGRIEKVVVHLR